jgi:FkbM family methyltransferase
MSSSFIKNTVYTLIDIITLGKGVARNINGVKIKFPARWSRYYQNDYESDNYTFLKQHVKEGMHILDIGAHLGLFSTTASQLTGRNGLVICFEPTPGTFKVLKETLRLNNCGNVIALQMAVSNNEGQATFYVNKLEGCSGNSLVLSQDENDLSSYDVRSVTIDGITKKYSLNPSLIKIDAEGAELDVLRGGNNTFKTNRPVVILGLHPDSIKMKGDSLKAIWDLLKSYNFKVIYDEAEFTETDFISQTNIFDVHLIPA